LAFSALKADRWADAGADAADAADADADTAGAAEAAARDFSAGAILVGASMRSPDFNVFCCGDYVRSWIFVQHVSSARQRNSRAGDCAERGRMARAWRIPGL
jgi:hypothetical protein